MFQRLAICVFVITFSRSYGQFQLSFGTPTPLAPVGPLVFDPNCKDALNNCWDFPVSSCQAPYDQWAKDNCPNRCGICLGPTTAAPPCVNTLSNCDSYDASICTNPDYKNWANANCRYFCKFCPPAQLAQIAAMTTTISPAKCVDKVDCRLYGPNSCDGKFKAWAKDNCPNHCKFCTGLPTAPPVCVDKIPNCKQYAADTCTNTMYSLWAEDNCKSYCGLCSGVSTINYNVPPSPPPPGKKRSVHKRQFSASHHHHYNKCWDTGSGLYKGDNPDCLTVAPPVLTTTVHMSLGSATTADFPGSDFRPNHKPTDGWDSKPSTDVPTKTTKSPDDKTTKTPDGNSTDSSQFTGPPPTVTPMNATKVTLKSPVTPANGSSAVTVPDSTTTTDATTTTTNQPDTTTSTVSTTQNGAIKTGTPPIITASQNTGTPSIQTAAISTATQGATNTSSSNTTPGPSISTSTSGVPTTLAPNSTTETRTPSTPTPTTTPTTTAEPCIDTISTCKDYGIQNCKVPVYIPFLKSHCASSCNFCANYTKCKDNLPNCAEFDDGNLCTLTSSYYGWASENCYLYCGFYPCGATNSNTAVTTASATTEKITTSSSPLNCTDKKPNCVYYDDDKCVGIYKSWAMQNCAKRCGYCSEPLPCVDNDQYCDKYPASVCTDAGYKGWARDNCRKFCGLCNKPTENPVTSQTGPSKTPGIAPSGTPPTPAAPVKSAEPSFVTVASTAST